VADYDSYPDDGFDAEPPWDSGAGPNCNSDNDEEYKVQHALSFAVYLYALPLSTK
jgi:hypothetical protein